MSTSLFNEDCQCPQEMWTEYWNNRCFVLKTLNSSYVCHR